MKTFEELLATVVKESKVGKGIESEILAYLEKDRKESRDEHYGWNTARWVADAVSITPTRARRHLESLVKRKLVYRQTDDAGLKSHLRDGGVEYRFGQDVD